MHRRRLFSLALGAGALAALPQSALALSAEPERAEITVYRSPTCGCCIAWVEHLQREGFDVEVIDIEQTQLYALKARLGLTAALASCHTASSATISSKATCPLATSRACSMSVRRRRD